MAASQAGLTVASACWAGACTTKALEGSHGRLVPGGASLPQLALAVHVVGAGRAVSYAAAPPWVPGGTICRLLAAGAGGMTRVGVELWTFHGGSPWGFSLHVLCTPSDCY